MVTLTLSFGLIRFCGCTDVTIVSVQDRYLIVAADNFYNNSKLREFMNWRLNEFDVEIVNFSTILNNFPIPPILGLLEIEELENMNTTIPDSRHPFIEAMWIDASGKYHRFGHYKYNPYVTPPRSEYNKNEIASEPQAIFLFINYHEVYEGDEITLTYDGGNTKVISLPKMRESYTKWTKLFITIDGTPFFEKTEAHSMLDCIKNVYVNASGKLKYVLLVGDVDLLPTFNMIYVWGYTPPTLVTDHLFACIDDNDYAPELALGRFPANDATELEVMINKTMNYRPIALNKFLLMEGFDAGEIGDLEYETTRSVIISSLQSWYENPNITELRKKNGELTKSNIIDTINSGQDFVIYCGHASPTCWHNLCTSDMVSLDNETPSIAFSFSCLSGDYGYTSDCMGEAFLKDEDSGVTGYFGSSTPTYSGAANRLAEELFRAIPYSNTIGEAILKSKVEYSKNYPLLHLAIYNLLGDPALILWIPGDVNGDGTVDTSDLFDLSKAYGCVPGDANWDGRCDFNEDNKVDILDVANLGKNYGKTV